MMIKFVTDLTIEMREVINQSYYHKNTSNNLKYPYLTYDISEEHLERNVSGFYLDVDLIDSNSSYNDLLALESELKAHFKDLRILNEELFIRFEFLRSNTINTQDEVIKRRNLQFYCKVDWRSL